MEHEIINYLTIIILTILFSLAQWATIEMHSNSPQEKVDEAISKKLESLELIQSITKKLEKLPAELQNKIEEIPKHIDIITVIPKFYRRTSTWKNTKRKT